MELQHAENLARDLMHEWGLHAWTLKFDKAKTRCGQCSHTTWTISLSRHFVRLNDRELVEDTVRHEIAHALVGPGHGHDAAWKKMARAVGAKPQRCKSEADGLQRSEHRYVAVCDGCGKEVAGRHRLSKAWKRGGYHPPCGAANGTIRWHDRHTQEVAA